MKIVSAMRKNLKLLFRSKESAYTIVFGPLLIILIVSFAFLGGSDYDIRLGAVVPAQTQLAQRTITTLNENSYQVNVYPDNETCVQSVRDGETHACLVFPAQEAGKGTVPITFYLDLSRINIVYQILDDLSGELDVQAGQIRNQLAQGALTRIQTAADLADKEAQETARIADTLAQVGTKLRDAQDALSQLPAPREQNTSELREVRGLQQGLAQNSRAIADRAQESLSDADSLIGELDRECDNCSAGMEEKVTLVRQQIQDAKDEIAHIADDVTKDQLFRANLAIEYAIEDVERAQTDVAAAASAGASVREGVGSSADTLEEETRALQRSSSRLAYLHDFLAGEEASADTITTPLQTSVVNIAASDDHLSFAYPYLLMLVVMFIGLLLSSTLIVTDKTSRAAFRNFTTPTSDGYHVLVSFITAFILLCAEVAILLLVSSLFVAQPLLLNPFSTLLIILVSVIFFTFLGMIIGYLSNTQEASMIASISVGSVLLFVSNLVLPIEGMAAAARALSHLNPYIVLSELLKRSMLYGVSARTALAALIWPLLFCVILLFATLWVQRRIRRRYFKQEESLLPIKVHLPRPLILGEASIHNEIDLMDALDRMTREEFDALLKDDPFLISAWAAKELRNKRLARKLHTKSKERMILKLDKYLQRHGKKLKR